MSDFIKFRRGECPICKGAEKRCTYLESENEHGFTSKLIFCRGTTNDPNYIFRGTAQQTGFGMWAYLPDVEAWKDSKKNKLSQEKYLQEKEAKKQQDENKRREKISNSLSLSVRDREIRKLINQLELTEYHKNQLLARGLTAAKIEKNGYRSVKQWQKLSIPVNNRLAGTSINGNKLNNPDSGILCPVLNGDGLFVGFRIKNDNPEIKELGKYTWLSSSGRGIDNKIPISELDEEFPIAVHYPDEWTDFERIGICEGLEFKSAIAAERVNYPVIGFSGNDFTSSPNLLKQSIETIQERICQLAELSKQLTSTESIIEDLEELNLKLNGIQVIQNKNNFEQLSPKNSTIQISISDRIHTQINKESLKNISFPSQSGIKIAIIPDSGINSQVATSYLKFLEHYKNYNLEFGYWNHLEEKGKDIDEIPADTQIQYLDSEEARNKLKLFAQPEFQTWLKHRKFTADIKFNHQYLGQANLDCPSQGYIIGIKSPLGSGKTWELNTWLKEELKNYGAFALGCRNTLLHHFCEATGFYHIHEHNFGMMRHDPQGQFALCVDSLLKFQPEDFDNKVIILDEVKSIIPHLLTSATIPKHLRNRIINLFKEAIRRSATVICLDGNLADWVVEFFRETAPQKKILTIENEFKKPREIKLYGGSVTVNGNLNNKDRTGIIYNMLQSPRPVIVADSQKECEKLDYLLSDYGYKVLRIDSSTTDQEYAFEFLANPNKYLEENQPDALILSPSAESGLDISIKNYFTDLYILAFGTLGTDSIRQISERIRDDEVVRHLWVNQSPKVKKQVSHGYQEVINEILKYSEEKSFMTLDPEEMGRKVTEAIKRNQERIETKTAEILHQIEAFEKANYLDCIIYAFEQAGYTIHQAYADSNPHLNKELKEIKEKMERERSHQIFIAEPPKKDSPVVSQLEKFARIKDNLLKKLPGIQDKDIWSEEFIYQIIYQHPEFLRQIDNQFLFYNPKFAEALKDKQLRFMVSNLMRNNDVSLWEFNRRYEIIEALHELELHRITESEPGREFTYKDEDIQFIYRRLRRRPKLREKLGIEKVSEYPIREVNRLLKMIGMGFECQWIPAKNGKRSYRAYFLNKENSDLPYKKVCYELTEQKWSQWVQKEIDTLTQEIERASENLDTEKIAKILSLHSLKLVTDGYNKLYNNHALSVISHLNKRKLDKAFIELSKRIAQKGTKQTEQDPQFRAEIKRNPLEVVKDWAEILNIDWQIFVDLLESVGDSVKFQLLGLFESFSFE